MEKISRIVRGNSRVAAVDLKGAAPVRPGTPSFGRPVGESGTVTIRTTSTADRALALHKEMQQAKAASTQETAMQNMADKFFMDRVSRSEPEVSEGAPPMQVGAPEMNAPAVDDAEAEPVAQSGSSQPRKYTPRGSYIDVRA